MQEESSLQALSDRGQDYEEMAASYSNSAPRSREQARAQLQEVEHLLAMSRSVHASKADNIVISSRLLL